MAPNSVTFRRHDHLVSVFFEDSLSHSYYITFSMFLYLVDIRINNGHFNTSVYDKRDNFSFSVVRFPFLDGNIPAKPTYGVYISQLVRTGRICDNFKAFNAKHTELTHRLMKQGFKYDKLCRKFKEFSRKHNHLIKKFHVNVHKHIKQGVSVPLNLSKKLARNVTVRKN